MIRTVHTSALDAPVRELLEEVFGDDLEETDWEHCLGGMHVLAYDGGSLVGHAAVVLRRMLHGGRALRCGSPTRMSYRPPPGGRCATCWRPSSRGS